MKNFTLLLFILLSLCTAYAQNKTTRSATALVDMPRQFSTNVTGSRSGVSPRSVNPVYDSVHRWLFDRTTKKWDNQERQIDFTYNGDDKNTGFVEQIWNDTFQTFQNSIMETYTYTGFDSVASNVILVWGDTGWVKELQWLYSYDGNNNLVTETLQTWDTTKWVNNYEQIRGFNAKNLDTNILIRGFDNNVWDTSEQFIYTYNAANLDTGELTQLWKSGAWQNSSRISNKYTGANVDSQYTYNASGSLWVYNALYTFTYNSNNSNTSFTDYVYSSGWVPITRYLYSYNASNFDTSTVTQEWLNSAWQTLANETDTYYPSGVEQSASYHDYNLPVDTIIGGDSTYWYIGTAGINQVTADNGQLSVYPNPSSDIIYTNIQLKQTSDLQLRLVNMLGQTMWSVDAGNVSSYQNNISVANLPGGVYLLEMVTGGGMETREIVVSH